jgi:ankyrin repeat protein
MTILHHLAMNGRSDFINLLTPQRTAVNVQDTSDMTPLHHAAARGSRDTVEALIQHGAEVNTKDYSGTSLYPAILNGHFDLIGVPVLTP